MAKAARFRLIPADGVAPTLNKSTQSWGISPVGLLTLSHRTESNRLSSPFGDVVGPVIGANIPYEKPSANRVRDEVEESPLSEVRRQDQFAADSLSPLQPNAKPAEEISRWPGIAVHLARWFADCECARCRCQRKSLLASPEPSLGGVSGAFFSVLSLCPSASSAVNKSEPCSVGA
jgi:hypothetical protein